MESEAAIKGVPSYSITKRDFSAPVLYHGDYQVKVADADKYCFSIG